MLKELRFKKGLSQGQLAKACGIPKSTLIKYENGYASINSARLDTLLKLCIVLECKLEEIITNSNLVKLLNEYNKDA